jgi:hypothetical protein
MGCRSRRREDDTAKQVPAVRKTQNDYGMGTFEKSDELPPLTSCGRLKAEFMHHYKGKRGNFKQKQLP